MNHMEDVARIFGVEPGELFSIDFPADHRTGYDYYFDKSGLFKKTKDGTSPIVCSGNILLRLLRGDYSIVKPKRKKKV